MVARSDLSVRTVRWSSAMTVCAYVAKRLRADTFGLIERANAIIAEYQGQYLQLTLRQLYYQFVARDLLPNKQKEYKRLGAVLTDGREAGLVDWHAIVDLTRGLEVAPTWSDGRAILHTVARQYREDKWAAQMNRVEVWCEKAALSGVIGPTCRELEVPYFACRGYSSASAMHEAAQRLVAHVHRGQRVTVLYLGDHDPSGSDMTRDVRTRLERYGCTVSVRRVALTMDQIDEHKPPPNPIKWTDSRGAAYHAMHGDLCWELDALDPATLRGLIEDAVVEFRDDDLWDRSVEKEAETVRRLEALVAGWSA
jgi:hypothetical protein